MNNYEIKSCTEKYLKIVKNCYWNQKEYEWSQEIEKELRIAVYAMKKAGVPENKMTKFENLTEYYMSNPYYDGISRVIIAICSAANVLINHYTKHNARLELDRLDDEPIFSEEELKKILGRNIQHKTNRKYKDKIINKIMETIADKNKEHNMEISKRTVLNAYEIAKNVELSEEQKKSIIDDTTINLMANRNDIDVAIQESWYRAVADAINEDTNHKAELCFIQDINTQNIPVITIDGKEVEFNQNNSYDENDEFVVNGKSFAYLISETYDVASISAKYNLQKREIIDRTLEFAYTIAHATGINTKKINRINSDALTIIEQDKTNEFCKLIQLAYANATANVINNHTNHKAEVYEREDENGENHVIFQLNDETFCMSYTDFNTPLDLAKLMDATEISPEEVECKHKKQ